MYVGRAIALILVVDPCGPSRFGRDWHAGFGDQLLRGLIQADDRAFGIARPVVDSSTSSMLARKRRWPQAE